MLRFTSIILAAVGLGCASNHYDTYTEGMVGWTPIGLTGGIGLDDLQGAVAVQIVEQRRAFSAGVSEDRPAGVGAGIVQRQIDAPIFAHAPIRVANAQAHANERFVDVEDESNRLVRLVEAAALRYDDIRLVRQVFREWVHRLHKNDM